MNEMIKLFWVILFVAFTGCNPVNPPVFGGTVVDIDGNTYHTVKIGSQTWMIENLRTTHLNDSTAIPMVADSAAWTKLTTPGYCWYGNDSLSNKDAYGALYNWYAVNSGKLAPRGWHVPTEADWTALENYAVVYQYASGSLSKILASKTNWSSSTNTGAIGNNLILNDASGFGAMAGGARDNTVFSFNSKGTAGTLWSSTVESDTTALSFVLRYDNSSVDRFFKKKWSGASVRCIKD